MGILTIFRLTWSRRNRILRFLNPYPIFLHIVSALDNDNWEGKKPLRV